MAHGALPRLLCAAGMVLCLDAAGASAEAQVTVSRRMHAARPVTLRTESDTRPVYRGLTINRPPREGFGGRADDQEIYRDGPTRYNSIRDFSPAPYVTSGQQFPYGFDGIGGYGSDLGFGAGQDTALYDRGAGTW